MSASRLLPEVMIEADYPVNFGAREVQGIGNDWHEVGRNCPQIILNVMQNLKQQLGLVAMPGANLPRPDFVRQILDRPYLFFHGADIGKVSEPFNSLLAIYHRGRSSMRLKRRTAAEKRRDRAPSSGLIPSPDPGASPEFSRPEGIAVQGTRGMARAL